MNKKIYVFQYHWWIYFDLCNLHKGAFIKDIINQGGGGFAKRWSYLISLFSKSNDKGGGGQKSQKNWWRLLWTAPKTRATTPINLCFDFICVPKEYRVVFSGIAASPYQKGPFIKDVINFLRFLTPSPFVITFTK